MNLLIKKTFYIIKTLYCRDAGFDCQGVIQSETEQEVLTRPGQHAFQVHGVTVTQEMAEKLKTLIKDDSVKTYNGAP